MASNSLESLRRTTVEGLEGAIQLTSRSMTWHQQLEYLAGARFRKRDQRRIVELAFLSSFLSWESFLEEAFVLYLLGRPAPSGYQPVRYVTPSSRQHAVDLTSGEARYADWTAPDKVVERAHRFFEKGGSFANVLRLNRAFLQDLKTMRNAIVHASGEAADKFRSLVRRELSYYPAQMTPGDFLVTSVASTTQPVSYITSYQERLKVLVDLIVPE